MPPWRRDAPLEYSEGTRPTKAASWRRVEAGQVAELRDDGERDDPLHPPQRLQRFDDGIASPARREVLELGFDPREALDLFIDGAHAFLEDDLLGGRRTDDFCEIPLVGRVPVGAPHVVQPEPEEKGLQSELGIRQGDPRGVARSAQITNRFILHGGHVDGGEVAGAEEPRELDGIAPIGLHLVPGSAWNERRRDDVTREPFRREVPIQAIPIRPGFVDEVQIGGLPLQPTNQPIEVGVARPDRADEHRRRRATAGGVGHRDGILMDIQADEEGVDCAMADLREHNVAVHATMRLWPLRLTRESHRGSASIGSHSV